MFEFHIGPYVEAFTNFLNTHLDIIFGAINTFINGIVGGIEWVLLFIPVIVLILFFTIISYLIKGRNFAIFTAIGLLLIDTMQLWEMTMSTLALVITSVILTLVIGIPLGIQSSRSDKLANILRPVLDFMQTMPAFVYLIPAVLFFGLGKVPGAVATIIFAMPPVVRLTNLGIRQVPLDVIEASKAFGSTERQMLIDVQLPLALPTIMTGINQTIMLALSMVVISSMIGAGGLGDQVLMGITQFEIGKGFEAGLAVVILAMILDRMTQSLGERRK